MAKSKVSANQLITAFKHKNFQPLYFMFGGESFVLDELQSVLIDEALQPHERDFNLDIVYGNETDARQVLALCASFPMMAERRVVIVRNFEKLSGNDLFVNYVKQPNPSAIVFLACATKPNLNQNPYRALSRAGFGFESKVLYDREIPGWINNRVQSLGYKIRPAGLQMLADQAGTNLRVIANEIEKLIAYLGTRTNITEDDVLHVGGHAKEYNVFALQKAVGALQYDNAILIMDRLLQQSTNKAGEAIKIISILTSYFTKLWKLTLCQGPQRSDRELAADVGISPFFVKEYIQTLKRYPIGAIQKALMALLAADFELKGGAERSVELTLLLLMRRLINRKTAVTLLPVR